MKFQSGFYKFFLGGLFCHSLFIFSCVRTYGVYHEVQPGENLYRIAIVYQVNAQEIAEINDIQPPSDIQVGQRIFIPDVTAVKVLSRPSSSDSLEQTAALKMPPPVQTFRGNFIWPVNSTVTSRYGMRNGNMHDGIDIGAKRGAPIKASASGRVIYSDKKVRGYGKMIIIKHEGVFSSVYAHNELNYVNKNDFVEKGEVIGRVGSTGRATGPHLHFEIRKGRKAVNPLFYLPNGR